jgi:uncharacterized protein YjbI with pentapeptide repeats
MRRCLPALDSVFRRVVPLLTATLLAATTAGVAFAQGTYSDVTKAEGWAWALIRQGKPVDMGDRCDEKKTTVGASIDKPDWKHACRRLSSDFVTDILTKSPWRDQVPSIGLVLSGAWIDGEINLMNAKLKRAIQIRDSLIEGTVELASARTDSNISIIRTRIDGHFIASLMHSEMSLILAQSEITGSLVFSDAIFDGDVNLQNATVHGVVQAEELMVGVGLYMSRAKLQSVNLVQARVKGTVNLRGATVQGDLDLNSAQAGEVFLGSLPDSKASYKGVDMIGAAVSNTVDLVGARFDGKVNLNSISARDLFLRSTNDDRATFQDVILVNARLVGNVQLDGSLFQGRVDAHGMRVGGTLYMGLSEVNKTAGVNDKTKTSFKAIDLWLTRVAGNVNMEGTTFTGDVSANAMEVGGHLIMCNLESSQHMDFRYIQIAGNLDARGAAFNELDLSGATIRADLTLGKHDKGRQMEWKGVLKLRNASTAHLMDVADAWPAKNHLQIDGFAFSRLGPESRTPQWWDEEWIHRDPTYTPGPYEQIAAAYAIAGDRGAADEMRFRGRVRQREEEKSWGSWLVEVFLEFVAGFGIGGYTFRVVWWVMGISILGALYLRFGVAAAKPKGFVWCLGASLSRLLPVIEINKEFTEFFHDPNRERLSGLQSAIFSAVAMLGWLLGAILVAAVAGLTQKP